MITSTSPASTSISSEQASTRHRSYDRIREAWLSSQDQGEISLREFVASPTEPLHISCEHLVELLGDAQSDPSEFGRWVFRQAALILAEISPDASYIDNNDFSHTAKYLFVGACFSSPTRALLDDSEARGDAARLVEHAVAFCEGSQSLGTTPLLIKGIIASNIEGWVAQGSVEDFFFKPESLQSPLFQQLLSHAREHHERRAMRGPAGVSPSSLSTCERFCAAHSPIDFLVWALGNNVTLPKPELLPSLKRILAGALSHQAPEYSFLRDLPAADQIKPERPSERVALELRRGIYVDVFGTLIQHDGTPNYRLAQVLKDLIRHKPSRPVYLVSDSQDEEIERALSFLEEKPIILSKDQLHGSELEYLIDNSEPDPQGLHARHYLSPDQAIAQARRLVDDDNLYFAT